jgi:hypothetical protein
VADEAYRFREFLKRKEQADPLLKSVRAKERQEREGKRAAEAITRREAMLTDDFWLTSAIRNARKG